MGVQVASFLLFSWRCAQEENCKGLSPLLILPQNVFVVLKATVSSLHERTKYFRFGKTEHNLVELIRVAIWFWLLPGKSVFCPPTADDKAKIGFRERGSSSTHFLFFTAVFGTQIIHYFRMRSNIVVYLCRMFCYVCSIFVV